MRILTLIHFSKCSKRQLFTIINIVRKQQSNDKNTFSSIDDLYNLRISMFLKGNFCAGYDRRGDTRF